MYHFKSNVSKERESKSIIMFWLLIDEAYGACFWYYKETNVKWDVHTGTDR